ncbi:MAG: hypothetical protein ACRDTG_20420 [Pseudonocardiaceae bacterium]
MEDDRPTQSVTLRLALAAGAPVLCIGFPFLDAFVRDHILTGAWVFVWYAAIAIFLWPATILAAAYIYADGYIRYKFLALTAAIGFGGCLVLTFIAGEERALAERGQIANCLVETVELRYRAELLPSGHGAYSVPEYVHHLQCPEGGPDEMVTSSHIADKGTFVGVLWDPLQRIAPQPARSLHDDRISFWLGVGVACVGSLALLFDALLDVRRVKIKRRSKLCEDTMQETMGSLLDLFIKLLIR